MIIVRAPLRISIAGGGTDLPFFSNIYGCHLLSAAIDKYNYIIIEKREFYNEIFVRYMNNEIVKNVNDIKHTRVKAALEYLNIDEPIEITSLADVPSGTGLGSSGTYLVALLKALHIYKRDDATIKQLAEEAAHLEIEILGEPVGKHDQYLAAYGGLIRLIIDMKGKVDVKPLEISKSTLFCLNVGINVRSVLLIPALYSPSCVAAIERSLNGSTKNPCLNLSIALLDSAGITKSFVCFSNKFNEL